MSTYNPPFPLRQTKTFSPFISGLTPAQRVALLPPRITRLLSCTVPGDCWHSLQEMRAYPTTSYALARLPSLQDDPEINLSFRPRYRSNRCYPSQTLNGFRGPLNELLLWELRQLRKQHILTPPCCINPWHAENIELPPGYLALLTTNPRRAFYLGQPKPKRSTRARLPLGELPSIDQLKQLPIKKAPPPLNPPPEPTLEPPNLEELMEWGYDSHAKGLTKSQALQVLIENGYPPNLCEQAIALVRPYNP